MKIFNTFDELIPGKLYYPFELDGISRNIKRAIIIRSENNELIELNEVVMFLKKCIMGSDFLYKDKKIFLDMDVCFLEVELGVVPINFTTLKELVEIVNKKREKIK